MLYKKIIICNKRVAQNERQEKVTKNSFPSIQNSKYEMKTGILNSDEAAMFINRNGSKSKSRLLKLTASNSIPHYKNGRALFFLESELRAWLLSNPIKTRQALEEEVKAELKLKGGNRK